MKKSVSIILFSILSVYVFGCSPILRTYFITDNKMYFGQWNSDNKEVVGVDTTTFIQSSMSTFSAKDKNHVYYGGEILLQANPNTYVFLGGIPTYLSQDGYSKDDKNVFFRNDRIDSVDVETFEVIPIKYYNKSECDKGYAKDQYRVFLYGTQTQYDVSTFKVLGLGYTVDKLGIYYQGKLLDGSSNQDYRVLAMYLKTGDKVFNAGKELIGVDAKSFKVIGSRWYPMTSCGDTYIEYVLAKDENRVYINDEEYPEIDAKTCVGIDFRPPMDPTDHSYFESIEKCAIKDYRGEYSIQRNSGQSGKSFMKKKMIE